MAGVRLEFAQFGHFEYFNIYRNSVSTAIENLGQPIGISSTMYYEDLTVEPNRDYYYRAGAIRDSAEEFSEEIHTRTEVVFDPPYDLVIEFKDDEINRLELNWKLDGFVNEQRYYCSETPIDTENLPVPKAVLSGDVRTYTDTAIDTGKTYYVAVGSVKNSVEKLSDEIKVIAEKLLVYMPLKTGLQDFGSLGLNWTAVGGVTYSEEGANFTQYAQYIYQNTHAFDFNADFKISVEVKRTGSINTYPALFDNDINGNWAAGCLTLSLAGQNASSSFRNKPFIGVSGVYDQVAAIDITNNQYYKFELSRISNLIALKVNDTVVLSYTDTSAINVNQYLKFAVASVNALNGQFIGFLRNLKIYDLS